VSCSGPPVRHIGSVIRLRWPDADYDGFGTKVDRPRRKSHRAAVSHGDFHKVFPSVDKSHGCHFDAVPGASCACHLCRNSRTRSFLTRCTGCKVCKAKGTNVYVSFCAGVWGPAQGCGDRARVWGLRRNIAGPRGSDGDVLCGVAVKLKGGLPYEQVFIADGPGVSIAGG
jgi:hypothetical protein